MLLVTLAEEYVLSLVATPTWPQLRDIHPLIVAFFIFIKLMVLFFLCVDIVLVKLLLSFHIIKELVGSLE